MSQTPTNYWSDNKAPTGTWDTKSVSYDDAALDNLTRSPLSDSNILNIGNLDNLTRLAGSLGFLFGGGGSSVEDYIKEATKALKKEQRRTTNKIDQRIENIYPGLTGMTGEEALSKYYNAFADTVSNVAAQGRSDLGISPNVGTEYDRLGSRIQDITSQYSLANQLGGYPTIASQGAAPGQVTTTDAASIRDVADWVDPATNQIKGKYKAMYDYGDPQTQRFIYGSRNTSDAIGRYYNTSGDVAGLMNYGGLG